MGEIVQLETRLERLWRDYNEAREKAQHSGDIRDGIKAGRAWAAFTTEFLMGSAADILGASR